MIFTNCMKWSKFTWYCAHISYFFLHQELRLIYTCIDWIIVIITLTVTQHEYFVLNIKNWLRYIFWLFLNNNF